VCDQETPKNEEAKARYRAVKIQPQWVVTPGKQTNKQTTEFNKHYYGDKFEDDNTVGTYNTCAGNGK
jgi:hypothetical protein